MSLHVREVYDVAVSDVVMAIGAFTLARLAELRQGAPVFGVNHVAESEGYRVTA